jgi:hypothetical protein
LFGGGRVSAQNYVIDAGAAGTLRGNLSTDERTLDSANEFVRAAAATVHGELERLDDFFLG